MRRPSSRRGAPHAPRATGKANALVIHPEAISLARTVMDEAMAAIATPQAVVLEADPDDHYDYQTRCIELAAHLSLPVVQAQVHLSRAWIRTLSDVEPHCRSIWPARFVSL